MLSAIAFNVAVLPSRELICALALRKKTFFFQVESKGLCTVLVSQLLFPLYHIYILFYFLVGMVAGGTDFD